MLLDGAQLRFEIEDPFGRLLAVGERLTALLVELVGEDVRPLLDGLRLAHRAVRQPSEGGGADDEQYADDRHERPEAFVPGEVGYTLFRVGGGGASAVELVAELLGAGLERCDVTGERLRLCLGLRRALRERI